MQEISFLNLEYIFAAFYRALTGIAPENVPATLQMITDFIEKGGVIASLIFLVGIVYAHVRIEQIHHAAHERRHHASDEALGRHHGAPKNARWEHVMSLMTSSSSGDWRQAILEADVILEELLVHFGIPGDTIGDKLKAVDRSTFNTLDLAWEAHRVRNDVAHGRSIELTEREARRTIDLFRQVFDEFGYI